MSAISIDTVTGSGLEAWLDQAARLRIAVFREFPYLYDGSLAYEQRYLSHFARARGAAMILALADGEVVGCATAMAMAGAGPEFQAPFRSRGMDIATLCYFGESVLLPAWRGQGIGHAFFDAREAHARQLGAQLTTFCAVQRPADHPLRPPAYRPLDAFWQKRGYQRQDALQTRFAWKDIDELQASDKTMVFWLRQLPGSEGQPAGSSSGSKC